MPGVKGYGEGDEGCELGGVVSEEGAEGMEELEDVGWGGGLRGVEGGGEEIGNGDSVDC